MADWIKSCLLNPRWLVSLAPILLFSLIAAAAYAAMVACEWIDLACRKVNRAIRDRVVRPLIFWTREWRND